MEITFTCPKCGEVTLIGEEFVGQSGECRACGAVVTAPAIRADAEVGGAVHEDRSAASPRKWGDIAGYAVLAMLGILLIGLCAGPPAFKTREASRRMSSQNNLRQIGMALRSFNDTAQRLPHAYKLTASGERTLSWRVAISPYLSELYVSENYRADEPCDSPANQEIAKRRRYVFEAARRARSARW